MCYWWKHSSQAQEKHSMKHWTSYNLLPLSSRQFYAIVIQNWAFIITLHNPNTTLEVSTHYCSHKRCCSEVAWPPAGICTCAARRAVFLRPSGFVFQQYTVKRHPLPVIDPAYPLLHLSIGISRQGKKEAAKAGEGGVGGGGRVEEKGCAEARGAAHKGPSPGPRSPKSKNCFMESGDGEKRA